MQDAPHYSGSNSLTFSLLTRNELHMPRQDHCVKLGLYAEVFALDSGALMPTIDQRNITNLKFFLIEVKFNLKIWVFGAIFPLRNEHENPWYLNDYNFVS